MLSDTDRTQQKDTQSIQIYIEKVNHFYAFMQYTHCIFINLLHIQ